jgi:hypothetical protein
MLACTTVSFTAEKTMRKSLLVIVLMVTALMAFGCKKEATQGSEQAFQEQAQKVQKAFENKDWNTVWDNLDTKSKDNIKKMYDNAKINTAGDIKKLQEQSASATGDAKTVIDKRIENLMKRQDKLQGIKDEKEYFNAIMSDGDTIGVQIADKWHQLWGKVEDAGVKIADDAKQAWTVVKDKTTGTVSEGMRFVKENDSWKLEMNVEDKDKN